MAGHSKWANIKFRKSAQDAKRGKIFTKLIREITVAARVGGSDEASNARLRDAVIKALKANMKRDTIDSAIKRGAGDQGSDSMEFMRYEGYAPGGIAVLVDCLSDNRNRTVSEVRHAFTKHHGHLGTDGSVAYLFNHQGEIYLKENVDAEKSIELAIDAGASDIETFEEKVLVITRPENYHVMLNVLEKHAIEVEHSELCMRASNLISLDLENAKIVLKLIDALEDLDDVQAVHTNADFPEEIYS